MAGKGLPEDSRDTWVRAGCSEAEVRGGGGLEREGGTWREANVLVLVSSRWGRGVFLW